MKIAVDALAARFGGTAYMVAQIVAALSERDQVEHVWALVSEGSIADGALRQSPKVTRVGVPAGGRLTLARRAAWEALHLRRLVRSESIDRVLTVSGMLPRRPGCSVVAHLTNPVAYESHSRANRLRRAAIARTLRHADAVIVPTAAMGELVRHHTGLAAIVLPLGVDHGIFSPALEAGSDLLYVSDFYAHKRHDVAIEAWLELKQPRPRLRFIGNPAVDPATFEAVSAMARAADPTGTRLTVESSVSLGELVAAYRAAGVFLMPSEHESFSMPLAEALACGVPAIVRAQPSLRETGGAGSQFVSGDDPAAWAAAIAGVIDDPATHERLRELALEHAQGFSWPAVADAVIAPAVNVDRDSRQVSVR